MFGIILSFALAAAPDEAEARKHFEAGRALFAVDRFTEAYEEFQAGFLLAPRPLFHFNCAQALRRKGETTKDADAMRAAKARYQDYLKDSAANEPDRERAREFISSIEAWLTANAPPAVDAPKAEPVKEVAVLKPPPRAVDVTTPPAPPPSQSFIEKNPWFLPVVAAVAVAAGVGTGLGVHAATTGCGAASIGCVDARPR